MEDREIQDMIKATENFIENHKGQRLNLLDISRLRDILGVATAYEKGRTMGRMEVESEHAINQKLIDEFKPQEKRDKDSKEFGVEDYNPLQLEFHKGNKK